MIQVQDQVTRAVVLYKRLLNETQKQVCTYVEPGLRVTWSSCQATGLDATQSSLTLSPSDNETNVNGVSSFGSEVMGVRKTRRRQCTDRARIGERSGTDQGRIRDGSGTDQGRIRDGKEGAFTSDTQRSIFGSTSGFVDSKTHVHSLIFRRYT